MATLLRKNPRLKPKPTTSEDPVLASYNSFLTGSQRDEDGTPYRERTVSAAPSTWTKIERWPATPFSRAIERDNEPGNLGACSLAYHTRKVINSYIDSVDTTVLRLTPWAYGKIIWADAVKTGRANLTFWSAFVTAYPDPASLNFLSPSRYYTTIPSSEPLQKTLSLLDELQFPGLVYLDLRLRTCIQSTALLSLPSLLPNVHTILVSSAVSAEVTDTLLRTWSCSGKLKRLTQLQLRGCRFVTAHALEYLSWLPALTRIDLTGCSLGDSGSSWSAKARQHGWTYRISGEIAGFEEVAKWVTSPSSLPESESGDTPVEPILGLASGLLGMNTPLARPGEERVFYRTLEKAQETTRRKRAELAKTERAAMLAEWERKREAAKPKMPVREKRRMDMDGLLADFARVGPPIRKQKR